MKIAYLINQYPQASQSFIRREIAGLVAAGVEVERFTVRRWDRPLVDPDDQAEQDRTRVVLDVGFFGLLGAVLATLLARPGRFFQSLVLARRCARRGDRGLAIHLIYLAEACVLRRWFAQSNIGHVHAHFGTNSTTVAMLVRALGGPPYSFTCHGPEEFDKPEALKLGEKVRRAAFVVAVSEYGRSQLYRWCGHEDWAKVHVVHCGVDESFLNGAPPPADAPRLVCVGRLVEQKGQLLLIEAAARLHRAGVAFELRLVGDGPLRGVIESLVRASGLEGKVILPGWMSNAQVRKELAGAKGMVLPSFAEGLPVVLMEAMALRRPVIATWVAGIPELVDNGISGWLVPAGDADALADAMRELLALDNTSLGRMGDAGAAKVRLRHDSRREATALAEWFLAQDRDMAPVPSRSVLQESGLG